MACPHVSGVAALLLSQDPSQTYTQIKERIMSSARPIAALRGKVGSGMLDAFYALSGETPPADPNDPTSWNRITESFESEHPYQDNFTASWEVTAPSGTTKMALHFTQFDTEGGYDYLYFYDRNGTLLGKMSGRMGADVFSQVFNTDYLKVEFKTDRSNTMYGFQVDSIAYQ